MGSYRLHGLYSNRSFLNQDAGAVTYDMLTRSFRIMAYRGAQFTIPNPKVAEELFALLKKACRPYSTLDHTRTNMPRPALDNIEIFTYYKEITGVQVIDEIWPSAKPHKKIDVQEYHSLENFGIFLVHPNRNKHVS